MTDPEKGGGAAIQRERDGDPERKQDRGRGIIKSFDPQNGPESVIVLKSGGDSGMSDSAPSVLGPWAQSHENWYFTSSLCFRSELELFSRAQGVPHFSSPFWILSGPDCFPGSYLELSRPDI